MSSTPDSNRHNTSMFALDAEHVRSLLSLLNSLRATGEMSEPELRAFFMQHAIGEWYSPLCDGMDTQIGHVLYRLTDFVEAEERASVRLCHGEDSWVTVEGWRQEWERMHPQGIPNLAADEIAFVQLAITAG